jgi:hypothetical protein
MNEPRRFTAGTTVVWAENLADYPASQGWTLKYAIRGANSLDIDAAASGDSFVVTITAAQTATLSSGYYYIQGVAAKGSVKYSLPVVQTFVEVNLALATVPFDARVSYRIVYDAIMATLLGRATKAQSELEIAGRRLVNMSLDELRRNLQTFEQLAKQQEAQLDIAAGKKAPRILVEFTKPA